MKAFLEAATSTLPEVQAFLEEYPFAVVPLGATEQHGPHLPFATDSVLAEALCRGLVQKSVGLLMPTIPLGYSWVWRDVPGTLTLRLETFQSVIEDIVRSLERSGIQAVCFVTGHEANRQPLKYALRERLIGQSDVRVLHLFYPGMRTILEECESRPWHGEQLHADEVETSLMLSVRPDLVHMQRAAADYPPVPGTYGQDAQSMGDLMNTGVFGDPTPSTADKGRRWLELSSALAADTWLAFLERERLFVKGEHQHER